MRSLIRRRSAGALTLCMLLALAGATVPVAAQARSHGHASKAKRKRRKPKSTTVLVRCAAVTVTCKGTPGPPGPQGPAGTNGTNGSNGANGLAGAALVARPHATAPFQTMTVPALPPPANVPLAGNTWTQQPGEVDYITGQMNVTSPASCVTSGPGTIGTLYLDGSSIGYEPGQADVNLEDVFAASSTYDMRAFFNGLGLGNPAAMSTTTLILSNLLVLPPPSVATPHTITAGLIDLCPGGTHHYTVNSFEIEVAAAK